MTGSSSRFLLIDDNPAHRALIKRTLRKAGFEQAVVEAESIAAGLTALHCSKEFALVIIDFQLTDGDGTQLLSAMRADARFCATPAVMISTSACERARCIAAGADAFISKCEDLEELANSFQVELRPLLR